MPDSALMARAIDFIEDNLQQAITVTDMADAVVYSLYHFCRTFNQATHHTPYDYLMRRRIAEAARELLRTDRRILDVALDYQFNSPETFSRAFRRVFGMSPSQWQKQGCVDRRQIMPRLTRAHLEHIARVAGRPPVLEERNAFHVAGIMTLVRDDPAAIARVWDLLAHELARDEPARDELAVYYGITYYPDDWERRGVLYLAAVEVPAPHTACAALVVKTIPALKYARFIHPGPTRDLPLTLDYIYHTWLPKSEQCLARPMVIERCRQSPQHADGAEFEREVYIPIE